MFQIGLPSKMSDVSGFEVWFQELKYKNKLVASCPDAMFFVAESPRGAKSSWTDLAKHYGVRTYMSKNLYRSYLVEK